MNNNISDKEYTPEYMHDRIIQDLINKLLYDEKETSDKQFDPYSLESNIKFFEANKFIKGVQKPTKPTKLKKAYKEPIKMKKAYKELKPAYLVTKVEMMKMTDDNVDTLGIFTDKDKYTKVTINGLDGDRYIATDVLRALVCKYLTECTFSHSKDTLYAAAKIDCKVLAPYLYKIVKSK